MQAILLRQGATQVELAELPDPKCQPGQVIVQALETGICGTDREMIQRQIVDVPPGRDYLVLGHEGLGKVVGRNVRIAPGASLENTVIGEESNVRYPIAIRNSVLFSGVEVDTDSDIEHAIIMESQIIQCDPEQLR